MKKSIFYICILCTTLLYPGCKTIQTPANPNISTTSSMSDSERLNVSSPMVYVYKTRKNYNNNVPIIMDDTKTNIVSYPHPLDLKSGNTYPYPTTLKQGYLLDNRGISKNVAFLSYTYEEYTQFTSPPSLKELLNHIIDRNPLLEMYQCGPRMNYNNIEHELNSIIESGFENCKRIVSE